MTRLYCPSCDLLAPYGDTNCGDCPACDQVMREFVEPEVRLTAGVFQPTFMSAVAQPTYEIGFMRKPQAGHVPTLTPITARVVLPNLELYSEQERQWMRDAEAVS